LQEQVSDSFRILPVACFDEQTDVGHRRVETRKCSVISDLSMLECKEEWKGLHSPVKIESERYFKSTGKTETDVRLYISSLNSDAKRLNQSVRSHWRVENSLH